MTQKFISLLLLTLALHSCAANPSKPVDPTEIVPAEQGAALIASIPGPPAIGTPEEIKDYQTLLNFQNTRTPADCARAASEVKVNLETFYGPPYGPLKAAEVEKMKPLFDQLGKITYHPDYIGHVKHHWSRVRPYLTHPDLHPCVKFEPSFSYPSGHSTMARIYYRILSDLYPKRKKQFLARADQIALDRNIGGVHFPTDIRDAKIIGDGVYEILKKTEAFQKWTHDLKEQAR